MRTIIYSLSLVSCLLLAGCSKSTTEPESAGTTGTTGSTAVKTPEAPKLKEGWSEVKVAGFSLAFPPNWKAVDLDPANYKASADAAFGTDPKMALIRSRADAVAKQGTFKLYAADTNSDMTKFINNLNVNVVPAQSGTLEQVMSASETQFKSMSTDGKVNTSTEKIAYGDAGLITTMLKNPVGGGTVASRLYVIKFGNEFVIFTFSSSEADASKVAADAKEIMDTFKVAS